jgi:hypothetical protein
LRREGKVLGLIVRVPIFMCVFSSHLSLQRLSRCFVSLLAEVQARDTEHVTGLDHLLTFGASEGSFLSLHIHELERFHLQPSRLPLQTQLFPQLNCVSYTFSTYTHNNDLTLTRR